MATDYIEFLALSPPRRALDKARFFLSEAAQRDVNELAQRREAVFMLDSALVAARGFIDIVRQHLSERDGWRAWWEPRQMALRSDPLWIRIEEARNEGVHALLTPATVVQHRRGGGEVYSELHFALRAPPDETDLDEVRFAVRLGATSALELLDQQISLLEDLMREVDRWMA
jgi:hypothetical protein